jgi:preprotein translocase subunit Sec63
VDFPLGAWVVVLGRTQVHINYIDDGKEVDNKKLYEILGVDLNADIKTIKMAYKKMAIKHHPDKGGDPDKVFILFKLLYF